MSDENCSNSGERISTLSVSLIRSFSEKDQIMSEHIATSESDSTIKPTPNISLNQRDLVDVPLRSGQESALKNSRDKKSRKAEPDKCCCRIF
jgi:hypothetical protein